MAWLFGGNNELDELIEKATSEMIPNGQEDMALNLDICDRIRSKQVHSKDAMRALKKRISHKNPNVQLLALKLSDVCVKNGGAHFLSEVASREFMDNLVQIVASQTTVQDVRVKILGYVQSWSHAFKSKPELSYVVDTFAQLKNQGYQFPSVEKTDAIMIDTTAPPEWSDSNSCERCRTLFTISNRKHHCRNCGKTFCNDCSKKNLTLPHLGLNQEVRVCENCYQKLSSKSGSQQSLTAEQPTRERTQREMDQSRKEDEELQRAIALSLLESEKQQPKPNAVKKEKKRVDDEEKDPELAAAIAASLKEMNVGDSQPKESLYPAPSSSSQTAPVLPARTQSQQQSQPQSQQQSANELSQSELHHLDLFAQLMSKMEKDLNGPAYLNITQDKDLKQMHHQLMSLHPKLVKQIEECVERHKLLMETHERLSIAVRTYDRLFEERLKQQQQQSQQSQQQQSQQQQYGSYGYQQQQPVPTYGQGYYPYQQQQQPTYQQQPPVQYQQQYAYQQQPPYYAAYPQPTGTPPTQPTQPTNSQQQQKTPEPSQPLIEF